MLSREQLEEILNVRKVIQKGHFRLSSGRHSDTYVQCARIFEYPTTAEIICSDLADRIAGRPVDIVLGPAVGAITFAYEMSRQLSVPNVFAERVDGKMKLRRGFSIPPDAKVLIVEDVITTGRTVEELFPLVEEAGADVRAIGCILDRSNGQVDFGVGTPIIPELRLDVVSWEEHECPLCAQGSEPVEPGSRHLHR